MKTAPLRAFQKVAICFCLLALPGFPLNGRVFAQSAPPQTPAPAEPPPIQKELPPVGVPTEQTITPGQTHRYRVDLHGGLAFRARVRRKGVALSLFVHDAQDNPLVQGDSASGPDGEVPLVFIPKENGTFTLLIESEGDPAAEKGYLLTVEGQREPTDQDRAEMLLEVGEIQTQTGNFKLAVDTFGKAIDALRKTGNPERLAQGLLSLSFCQMNLGRLQPAEGLLKEAFPLYQNLGFEAGQQLCLSNLSTIHSFRGDFDTALEYSQRALVILRNRKEVTLQLGISLSNHGHIYRQLGNFLKSIEARGEALAIFRKLRNQEFEGATLANIGDDYRTLKNLDQSLVFLEGALAIFRNLGDRKKTAETLIKLGAVQRDQGELDKALANTLESLAIFREAGDRRLESVSLNNQGKILERMGRVTEAIALYKQALGLLRATEFRSEEVDFLINLANAEQRTGDLENALKHIEEVIAILDPVRAGIGTSINRASFSGFHQIAYSTYFEVLQALHAANPGQGYDLRAFQVSEKARARTLVEQLTSRKTDLREGVDRELLAQQTEARKVLDAKSQALARATNDPEKTKALKAEVEVALENYRLATRKLDEASPRYARAVRPSPLSLDQMRELFDSDTVLLEFGLGGNKSFLWVVTQTGFRTFELPSAGELQRVSRQAYQALMAQNELVRFETPEKRIARLAEAEKQFSISSKTLSDICFGPIATEIKGKKLVIVADGALLYLPFAALPFPGTNQPLITHCEISQLPSISTLVAIRADASRRPAPSKTLVVLADPVFNADDERVKAAKPVTGPVSTDARRATADLDGPDRGWPLRRLPFTRKEAQAVSALVPAKQRRVLVDFPSSRQNALADDLGNYRFIHLATHGLANDRQPDLSGMIFSMVDEKGQPTDGFLHAYEVFNLKLPAEMVVLSGCRTGLGQEIQGEGLIGLTQAFLYAGAARVMVSLWSVQDESTSILMAEVYRGMLGPKKLRPSAALREAQLKMMKNPRWASPFYWAAFTIQGEPR
jgi:CHAT domain-containing protein